MIKEFEGYKPNLDDKTFIAENAVVIGQVTMQEYSSIWYGCVARGDINRIIIGRYSNIQDGSVLHVSDTCAVVLGDFVSIGHNATLHGCVIEEHCLIGMGAILLNGATVGKGSIIASGALVQENHEIPPYSLVVGVPGKVVRSIHQEWDKIHSLALKYKTLWTERYGLLPNAGGERYHGEKIV